ncbi:MAG TPA: HAMP domain-containing sensor histidine kinase [Anaeromyxobacteraceae bacterium]|nr:HAMP domain-containing sensor histidine kinase [Anaeromyxobacteraceae bacterium]
MNHAAAISTASTVLGIALALVALRVSRAETWRNLRWFALVSVAAATYAFGNLISMGEIPDVAVVALCQVQVAASLVELYAWLRFVDWRTGAVPGRAERIGRRAVLALAVVAVVPGLTYGGAVSTHRFAPWGVTYRDAIPNAFGLFCFAAGLVGAGLVLVRLVVAWRCGLRHGLVLVGAFALLFLLAVNDAAVASGALAGPYLLDVGFLVPLGAVAYSLAVQITEDADALGSLRGRLEALVEHRTQELSEAQVALHQAEKLAALGQFASGVAHEVNNPAAVVTSNLRYLADALSDGEVPEDAATCVGESLEAMQRINALVRRLVDAGRLAEVPATSGTAALRGAAEHAVREAQQRAAGRADYAVRVPAGAQVEVRAEVLHQILSSLLDNAGDAVPPGKRGRIEVTAEPSESGRLRITVSDDGAGMTPDVLRRAFEPFFTTKAEGQGAGLGLPVARALAESHGGELHIESLFGEGTRAVLFLPGRA